jgi:hypothetical protein
MDLQTTMNVFNTGLDLEKIRAAQESTKERTALERERFQESKRIVQQILDLYQTQFGSEGARFNIPQEFRRSIDLFRPGGQFGRGGQLEARRGAQQALASGQIGLTQTGMSSGTNVAGLRARVAADEALARKKISDERVAMLAGAFGQAGQAGLTTQQLQSAERTRLMDVLSRLRV